MSEPLLVTTILSMVVIWGALLAVGVSKKFGGLTRKLAKQPAQDFKLIRPRGTPNLNQKFLQRGSIKGKVCGPLVAD